MNVNVLFLILSIALIPCETGRVKGRCGVSSKLPDSRARGSNQMDSDNSFTAIEESNSTINKINAKKSEATEYEISTPKSTISSKTTDPLEVFQASLVSASDSRPQKIDDSEEDINGWNIESPPTCADDSSAGVIESASSAKNENGDYVIENSIQFELDSESSDGSEDKDDSYKDSEEKEVSNSYQKNAKSIKDYGILEKENDISESDSDDLWTINGDTEEVAEGNYEDEKSEKKADFIDEREKFELEINESDSENEKLKDIRKTLIPSNDDDSSDRDEITSEKDDSILNPIKSAGRDYRIQKDRKSLGGASSSSKMEKDEPSTKSSRRLSLDDYLDENFEKRHKTKKGKKNFEKSRRRRHHMDQIDEEEPSSSNSRRSPRYQRNDKNEESSERKSPKNSDMSKPKNLAENLGNVICSIIKGEENIKTKQFRKNVQNTNQNTMKNLREFSRLLFDWKLTTND